MTSCYYLIKCSAQKILCLIRRLHWRLRIFCFKPRYLGFVYILHRSFETKKNRCRCSCCAHAHIIESQWYPTFNLLLIQNIVLFLCSFFSSKHQYIVLTGICRLKYTIYHLHFYKNDIVSLQISMTIEILIWVQFASWRQLLIFY